LRNPVNKLTYANENTDLLLGDESSRTSIDASLATQYNAQQHQTIRSISIRSNIIIIIISGSEVQLEVTPAATVRG